MTEESKKQEVGYVVNWSADLGNGNGLTITGNLPKDCSLEDMNAEFDKLRSAFNRQQAKSAALTVEQEIDRLSTKQKQTLDAIARLDKKEHTTAAERTQREAAVLNANNVTEEINARQTLLKKLANEAK